VNTEQQPYQGDEEQEVKNKRKEEELDNQLFHQLEWEVGRMYMWFLFETNAGSDFYLKQMLEVICVCAENLQDLWFHCLF